MIYRENMLMFQVFLIKFLTYMSFTHGYWFIASECSDQGNLRFLKNSDQAAPTRTRVSYISDLKRDVII